MNLTDFTVDLRFADGLDIIIVGGFVYVLLAWLFRAATRAAVAGVLALGALYVLARSLGMVLTTNAFHAGAIVMLVALVVVFQEDVRRGLQGISLHGALFRHRQRRSQATRQHEIELLVETSEEMADKRIGALIVLVGKEPISAHLSSGIINAGELHKTLLLSIFHPGSPGHDGAVVIDGGQLWQFAAHLPLAHQPLGPELGGTRHRAAVGLSERCDALIITVSEERGVISVAEGGRIEELASGDALRQRLTGFFTSRFPSDSGGLWAAVTHNLHLKLASLALAVLAWTLLVAGPGTIHRTFAVPIEYRDLPSGLSMGNDVMEEARVTLSGPEIAFQSLDPSLLRISLNVADARPGINYVLITEQDLRYPPRLQVEHLTPREIIITVERAPVD